MQQRTRVFTLAVAVLLLPALTLAATGEKRIRHQREIKAKETMQVAPWQPSLERRDWPGKVSGQPRPDHHYYSPSQLERMKASAFVDPDLAAGRAVEEESLEPIADQAPLQPAAPKRTTSFDGLDTATAAFMGETFFPPDTSVAASETKVLEVANVGMRLSQRNGRQAKLRTLNSFFGEEGPILFDPKVHYDRLSGRFLVVALSVDFDADTSHIYLAVSKSGNPSDLDAPGSFCTYRFRGKRAGSWADYPGLGVNESRLAITVNNFNFSGGFKAVYLYTVSMAQLLPNAGGCPGIAINRFKVRRDADGETAFTLQPAQHYDLSGYPKRPLFFVSAQFRPGGNNRYAVWRLNEASNGKLQLSSRIATSRGTYSIQPVAEQQDGLPLDTGDTRVMQAAFRNGSLWAVHGTGCSIDSLPNEACIRAVEIGSLPNDPEIVFEETYGKKDTFYFWPGIAVNARGDVVVAFQTAKASGYLGIAYNGKRAGRTTFDGVKNLRKGRCALDNFSRRLGANRTGDYATVQTDPQDNLSFFLAGEYTGQVASLGCDWRTRVGRVKY